MSTGVRTVWEVEVYAVATTLGQAPAARTRCSCGDELDTTDPTELGAFVLCHSSCPD